MPRPAPLSFSPRSILDTYTRMAPHAQYPVWAQIDCVLARVDFPLDFFAGLKRLRLKPRHR